MQAVHQVISFKNSPVVMIRTCVSPLVRLYSVPAHYSLLCLMTSWTLCLQLSSPWSQYGSTFWLWEFHWLSVALAVHVCTPDVCLLDVKRAVDVIALYSHFTWSPQQPLPLPSSVPHTTEHRYNLSCLEQVDSISLCLVFNCLHARWR